MTLQYEFDSFQELHEAMKNLSDYHDCEKSQEKIVCISIDHMGNTCCAYCDEIVRYPKLSKKGYEIEKENFLKNE